MNKIWDKIYISRSLNSVNWITIGFVGRRLGVIWPQLHYHLSSVIQVYARIILIWQQNDSYQIWRSCRGIQFDFGYQVFLFICIIFFYFPNFIFCIFNMCFLPISFYLFSKAKKKKRKKNLIFKISLIFRG